MKKTFLKIAALFAVVVATTTSVLAQGSFAYQAVIRDSKGDLVKDKDVNAKFSLGEQGKDAVYVETQKVKTNQYGNISVMVGSGAVESGKFTDVPWNTMNVMMKVEIDVNGGTDFKPIGEIQLQPVPYAFYAASAGSLTNNNSGEKDPIFSVKDDNGELVFAVYNDGVKVFVDDTDPSKAMSTGFAVSGRRAAKDGETNDYFVVNGKGTQVYVDEDASGKAISTGFAVSGRKAAKDGSGDLFTVNSEGTQVFIDSDPSKAMSTGFAVSGRRAAKDGANEDYLTINTDKGTQVFIDDDPSKAMSTGFAVSGRRAAKDEAENFFTINTTEGTMVYVDDDPSKAMSTGFAVAGRRAAKDGEPELLLQVNGEGTQVFIDDDPSKAMSTGFAVSGRRAAKDSAAVDYLYISDTTTQFTLTEFLVKEKGSNVDLLSMNNSSTKFKGSSFSVSDMGDVNLLAVENGNVHINSDMVMSGDVEKKADVKVQEKVIEKNAVAPNYAIEIDGVFDYVEQLSLLKVVGESVVLVQNADEGLAFTADGSIAKNANDAAIRIWLDGNNLVSEVMKIEKDITVMFGVQNGYVEGAIFKVTFKK